MKDPRHNEEFEIFYERVSHFLNLREMVDNVLRGHKLSGTFIPRASPAGTLSIIFFAYFYSLIDRDRRAVNAFRVWREHFPQEHKSIQGFYNHIVNYEECLRTFRNRVGFHGSRTRSNEDEGYELLSKYSVGDLLQTADEFLALSSALLSRHLSNDPLNEAHREQIDQIIRRAKNPFSKLGIWRAKIV